VPQRYGVQLQLRRIAPEACDGPREGKSLVHFDSAIAS
jgi:hypothetical protein